MKKLLFIIGAVVTLFAVQSCKTTEANYRAAYEKAVAGRDEGVDIDSTIYGKVRRQMTPQTVTGSDGRTYEVKSQLVRLTPDGGGIRENLREFNVIAGQFKQLFNARSLRERLVDLGYPEAFVVQTAEPYYYVIIASRKDVVQAGEVLAKIKADPPVPMKEPCPFILKSTNR